MTTHYKKSLIAALGGLLLGATVQANAETIRIAIDGSYAPFAVVDNEGQLQGFDVDIANALCEQMQADCEIVSQPWEGIISGLKVKKFDAIVSSMSVTEERARAVDFSSHYYSNVLTLLGAKSLQLGALPEAMYGRNVGAYRSTVSSQYLEDNFADQVNIKLYDNQENAYLDLTAGRIDLLVSDKFPAWNWLQSKEAQGFEFKGDDIDIQDKVAVAVRKGSKLKEAFSKAIAEIVANGRYQEINQRYFPFSIY